MATNSSDNEVIVAMVPFPDYSHLNQLFVLARFIAPHNIPVYFLSLADMNQDLKLRVQANARELLLLEPHVKLMVRMEHELEFHSGEVINSCKEVEGKYIDLLAKEKRKPSWAFGPFHMLVESHDSISSSSSNMTRHECLEFLDKQYACSVIFVSFGSTTTLSQEQVNEVALGLKQSNHRFIWVLRKGSDDKEKLREKDGKIDQLPEGFGKRVEGKEWW
ncbi:putative V-type proton ATPase subunit H-like [Capsicum annuum]|uniref:Glycosyltransferase N-terminal domain-containing protein n=2 Tax=Capsicum annuum TaxID=4072 RepID=A0A2G2YVI3_CAPAN|nr:putative V-type proton ATPase subunit H-like [Capsicum annuum]KAF3654485.1 putative V-type proton ATPase subunit H-like [Capsicum annuum]PHT73752.1 hypothetical protein T459_24537 [Capsicum annuum]PHT73754.1 hypothetical protein T459_24539 [Capsicum annuum]